MRPIKKFIVWSLERLCALLDRHRDTGCRIGLAEWSFYLNERWNLGSETWKRPDDG